MPLSSAVTTALSGMNAAAKRLGVSASNVANAETVGAMPTATTPSTVYRALEVRQAEVLGGGVAATVTVASPGWRPRADADSTLADEQGLIAEPSVDQTSEIIEQITARHAYEASAKVLETADRISRRTIDVLT
jgi:flagellar basal-body rod protein FlgC